MLGNLVIGAGGANENLRMLDGEFCGVIYHWRLRLFEDVVVTGIIRNGVSYSNYLLLPRLIRVGYHRAVKNTDHKKNILMSPYMSSVLANDRDFMIAMITGVPINPRLRPTRIGARKGKHE